MDRSPVFVARSRTGARFHRGSIRAARAARAPRVEGADARSSVFLRQSAAGGTARVLFQRLARRAALAATPGEPAWLLDRANGFFSVAEIPATSALWCLATGTGLGPFLSILRTAEPWEKFERVVLVHAVRYAADLSYSGEIGDVARDRAGRFSFVPIVSREAHRDALSGRIPEAIGNGRLEAWTGVPLTAENSHAMLCGNPDMVRDTQAVLDHRGMRRHRRREPGHVTLETYW
jgi:ferredoxin--NADP+ reductase